MREEDLLLYSVSLGTLTLTDSLATYGAPEDPLIPLRDLAQLLDLDLDVSAPERRVTGRIGEAQRMVTIDLATGTARVAGKPVTLVPQDYAVTPSDIYFRASALQKLLPITIKVDAEALEITLTALEPLPLQQRLARAARDQNLGTDSGAAEPVLKIASPYQLYSVPAFDIGAASGLDTTKSGPTRRFDVRMGADVFYTGFQGFAGSDEVGRLTTVRATFERHEVGGGLLGPIDATRASGGDIFTPSLPIGATSMAARGFAFSTAPLEETSVFDHIDLRGELPIGYDAELYINDILRSGQRTPVQGRYEFLNVPLVRGINLIRIVLYGPHGERTEQVRVVNVSSGQVTAHTLTFQFGIGQQNMPLLPIGSLDLNTAPPGTGKLRAVGSATYGLTGDITLVGGAALIPFTQTDSRGLGYLGARTSILGLATQIDAAYDSKGGSALALGLAGQPFGIAMLAQDSEYQHGFIDESFFTDPTKPLLRHSSLSLDGALPVHQLVIPLSASVQNYMYRDGSTSLVANGRTSWTMADMLISDGLQYQRNTTGNGAASQVLEGNFSLSSFAAYEWQLRGTFDYGVLPTWRANAFAVTADRIFSPELSLHLGVGQSLGSMAQTTFQTGGTYRSPLGDLSLQGSYTPQTNIWNIGVQLAFGVVFDPIAGHYGLTRSGVGTQGSAAFQAFVDRNGNGVFDAGDEPVPKVVVDGGERSETTDTQGQALLTGLGTPAIAHLQVGLDDIDDPYVQSPPHTVEFSPRAGQVVRIPYPLIPTGEVLFKVFLTKDGKQVGLSSVRIRLVKTGAPPVDGLTEFDGTVSFEHIAIGSYRMELDPDQAARLHMHLKTPVSFTVPADGGFVPDQKAEVEFEAAPAPAAPPAKVDPKQ